MDNPRVVSREEWLEARKELLAQEKAFTRTRDELSRTRRQMPWTEVTNDYRFQTPEGEASMADLFAGRSQLVVYHFMYGPDWKEGCKSCSFWADNFNGIIEHLAARDTTLIAISRAPLDTRQAFCKRMGWRFRWVSSAGSNFNYDFHVSYTETEIQSGKVFHNFREESFPVTEAPGVSVFVQRDGRIYHSYSAFSRGLDILNTAYHYLDLTPKGRDEEGLLHPMAWLRHREKY